MAAKTIYRLMALVAFWVATGGSMPAAADDDLTPGDTRDMTRFLPGLEHALTDPMVGVRRHALEWLLTLTPVEAAGLVGLEAYIREALRDSDDPNFVLVGLRALNTLGRMGPDAAEHVLPLLSDDNSAEIRRAAAEALGWMGPDAAEHAPNLVPLLSDDDRFTRRAAAEALAQIGPDAAEHAPNLVPLLSDDDRFTRRAAAEALAQIGPDAAEHVLPLLSDDNPAETRQGAAEALGWMGPDAAEHAPSLVPLLSDDNPADVRHAAVWALGGMGPDAAEHVLPLLSHDNPLEIWRAAAEALGQMGPDVAEHVLPLLSDDSPSIRHAAVYALMVVGSAAAEHAPMLVSFLSDDNPAETRQVAALALGEMGPDAAEHASSLVPLLSDDDPMIWDAAVWALVRMGPDAAEHAPSLVPLLSDDDRQVQRAAAWALGWMGPDAAEHAPSLVPLLSGDNPAELRKAAAKALGRMGPGAAEHVLPLLSDDNSAEIRRAAAEALGGMGPDAAEHAPRLVPLLSDDDRFTRRAAAEALGHMGPAAAEHRADLILRLNGEVTGVRDVTITSLKKIGVDETTIQRILLSLLSGQATYEFNDVQPLLESSVTNVKFPSAKISLQLLDLGSRMPGSQSRSRFVAHIYAAGDDGLKVIFAQVGLKDPPPAEQESEETARAFLAATEYHVANLEDLDVIRREVESRVGELVRRDDLGWGGSDLTRLKNLQRAFADRNVGNTLQWRIQRIERQQAWWRLLRGFGGVFAVHLGIWAMLLIIYPYSPLIRAWFFWNPWVRKIAGAAYVGAAVTAFAPLRRRLLRPFRKQLLGLALDSASTETPYFENATVTLGGEKRRLPDATRELQGRVLLEGPSGSGKTRFLKHRLEATSRLAAYLPAPDCNQGVVQAIRQRVPEPLGDDNFWETLISAGAVDIYIDGLNEATPETRAIVRQFAERHSGLLVVATQPIGWKMPDDARHIELLPLEPAQIVDFLHCAAEADAWADRSDRRRYEASCQTYVDSMLSDDQPEETRNLAQELLSNPMDLTVVAQMLAQGESPEVFRLYQIQYERMAQQHQTHNVDAFRLTSFSRRVYEQLQGTGDAGVGPLPASDFLAEVESLERYRMAIVRTFSQAHGSSISESRFRHEKIMAFFVGQHFIDTWDNEAGAPWRRHLGDTRFATTYLTLASRLRWSRANILREALIQHAAQTGDHSTADAYVLLLERRERVEAEVAPTKETPRA